MKPMCRSTLQTLYLALSLLLLTGAALAESARTWTGDELRGIHYAVERNSLLPDRWRAELQHTDDCQAPCTVEFDDRMSAVHLRYGWMQLNPAKGVYDFDDLGAVIDIIHAAGKKATLVVMAGKYTPPWIFDEGAAHLQMQFRHVDAYSQPEVPVPWDPVFVAAHGEMIAALSDFLRQTPSRYETLALVKNGALTSHSGETRLMPPKAFVKRADKHDKAKGKEVRAQLCTEFAQAGYSEDKVLWVAQTINAQIATAFPDKYLGLAFVAGSDRFPTVVAGKCAVPEKNNTLNAIIKEMVDAYGPRSAIISTVLTESIGNPPVMKWTTTHGGRIGFQLNREVAGCHRRLKAQCDPRETEAALRAGIDAGALFIEVHEGNINRHINLLRTANRDLEKH